MNNNKIELNIEGCENITKMLLEYLNKLILSAASADYPSSQKAANDIVYATEILKQFFPQNEQPKWLLDIILHCSEYAKLKATAQDFGKRIPVINELFFNLKNFRWQKDTENKDSYIDLDHLFAKEAASQKLNDAVNKLIQCLQIVHDNPEFKLDKKTKTDIETVINGLRGSKGASESAIGTWLAVSKECIMEFVPLIKHIDLGQKWLIATQEVYDEVSLKFYTAKNSVKERFCTEFINPRLLELPEYDPQKLELPVDGEGGKNMQTLINNGGAENV